MPKSIQEITDVIVKFSEDRGWLNERPNELITSIMIELAELAENYQWKNSFEEFDAEKQREVGYEFVDVIFYLFRLAHKSGVDIEKYFDEKLPKLEEKFPIGITKEEHAAVHQHYRKTGKNRLYS